MRLYTFAALLLIPGCVFAQHVASPLGASIPGSYIVVYRDGHIPGNAEARAVAAGARVLRRHDRLGVAIVQGSAQEDGAELSRLQAQPDVVYVLHDRIVTGHALVLQPMQDQSNDPLPAPVSNIRQLHTVGEVIAATATDADYASPQGWAVRQVGGYGRGIAGGLITGPWNVTMGAGVRIAVLDSGVDTQHPDIAPNLALNISEVNQQTLPSACDDGSPQDQQGHGTWIASLAAGAVGASTGLTAGVAPQASILNIKVMQRMPSSASGPTSNQCAAGQANGLLSWVIQGIEDAVANRADVAVLSLGTMVDLATGEGAGLKASFDQIAYAALQAGTIIVAAAGNDGFNFANTRYMELPAQARGVLAIVASTNPACAENLAEGASCLPGPVTLPYYSNYGAPLNALAAPGGSYPQASATDVTGWIRGACSSGKPGTVDGLPSDQNHSYGCFNLGHMNYVQAMGTSASAALAAGVIALVRAANPTLSATDVIARVRATAQTLTTLPAPQIDAASAISSPAASATRSF